MVDGMGVRLTRAVAWLARASDWAARTHAETILMAEQGGQRAAYLVRWVSATGEPGPWGETTFATIAA
jgi:hypothetical protein